MKRTFLDEKRVRFISKIIYREWFLFFIFIVLCWYLFVFKLGEPSLWETDEAIYGEVAREILKTGDWITLHFNYKQWFDKPPLYMWITAFFYRFFGWNEFTTRLGSALFGIAEVIAVYFFGKILFNKRTGFFSGIILATSLQFIIQSRLALVDVPLSFFITLSIFFFYLGFKDSHKRRYFLFSSLFMALATLTKGPIGMVIPFFVIMIFLFLTRNLNKVRKIRFFEAAAVFILVAFPWYVVEIVRHGRDFIESFFLLRNVARFTTPFEGRTGPFYYYVPVLFLGFFPWSSFLPLSFIHLFKKKIEERFQKEEKEKTFLILIWFTVVFAFFSAAKSKLPGYIFPLYPACALSVGKLWDDFSYYIKSKKKGVFMSFAIYFFLTSAFALAIFLIAGKVLPLEYNLFKMGIFLIIISLFAAGIFSFIFLLLRKNTYLSVAGLVGGMCFLTGILTLHILPLTEVFKPTKFLANQIRSSMRYGEKIGNYPASNDNFMSFNCSLIYYSDHPVEGIKNEEELRLFLASRSRVYCLMRVEDYQKIKNELKGMDVYVFKRKDGEIVLTNKKS